MKNQTEIQEQSLNYLFERKLCADAAGNTEKAGLLNHIIEKFQNPQLNWNEETIDLPIEKIIELLKDSIVFQTILWRSYYKYLQESRTYIKTKKQLKNSSLSTDKMLEKVDKLDKEIREHKTEPKTVLKEKAEKMEIDI